MKFENLKRVRLLGFVALLMLVACATSLLTALKEAFASAPPVVASFQAAGKLTPLEAQNLNSDFSKFSSDAERIASASTPPERIEAIKQLSDDFVKAAPDFHLGHPEANSRFTTVYTIAGGILTSIEIYYGAPVHSTGQARAAARSSTPQRRPTEDEIKRQIEELKKALNK
jgi:hypothetical protein